MYNEFQTRKGVFISNVILAILAICLSLFFILTGCVSAKKYKALKHDLDAINASVQSYTWANDQLRNDVKQLNRQASKMQKTVNEKRAISNLVDSLIKKEVNND